LSAFERERTNPRDLPAALIAICGVLLAIGIAAFAYGLSTDPDTAWRAYHVNFIYFATLAQGGLCLACAIVIIDARWPGPIRHVAEGLAAWVPISFVLLAIDYFGRESIQTNWIHGAPPGKEHWLTIPRVYITDLAILFVLAVLSIRFLKLSVRPALEGAAERAPRAKGMFARWGANWRGEEVELAESTRKLRVLAPIIALLYTFGYTVVGYDQVMSLTPTWYSTMFGWYFTWSGFLSGIAMTALICVFLRNAPGWEGQLSKDRFHDLGKMLFAFSIFWMYLFFSQYIVIWYGNLPEETQFFELRLGSQFLQDTWHFAFDRLKEPYVPTSLVAWSDPARPGPEAQLVHRGSRGDRDADRLLARAKRARLAVAGSSRRSRLARAGPARNRGGFLRRLRARLPDLQPCLPDADRSSALEHAR
jgi:Ni/Fe-hydrogenase subunit HybB-like protein